MAETRNIDDTLIMDQPGKALSQDPDDAAPKRVAHYDLKREIGRGALSVVYEAEDTHTGQDVALKLLSLSSSLTPLEAEALIARFEREARTAARLSHPNIVHIHEVGAEGDQHFLAMEYLKGQTLRKRMGEGPLPPAEVFATLAQIAGALDAVHKAGIVHRDVKPTNIILLPDGMAKLLDFGIARSSRETAITHRGMITGSPSYMAPEQVKGETGAKATDLWALGVLAYEMLTGHLPFTGLNIGGVMFQIMHEAPASTPNLPPAVQKVLLRALDKRPSQRYATAGALVQALKLAHPSQVPAAPEQTSAAAPKPANLPKPAKLPKPANLPKPAKLPKPAASFSLPGPRWLPEAALLSLFLLGFGGAYLARLHTDSSAQKVAASLKPARSLNQTSLPVSVQAPAHVLQTPQRQGAGPDISPVPEAVPAPEQTAPAMPVLRKAQEEPQKEPQKEPQDHQAAPPRAAVPAANPAVQAKQIVQAKPAPAFAPPAHTAHAVVPVPVKPRQPAVNTTLASSRPAPIQAAERSEPEQASVRPAPAPSAAPPVPAQSIDQAVTLPAGRDSYDPEADARRRKSAWSQEGAASQP